MKNASFVIKRMNPKTRMLALKLRRIIKKTLPRAVETVKWGKPFYTIKEKNLLFICGYKDHVNLEFFTGSKMKSKLLEGTGKNLRHIKVRSLADIKEKKFAKLLKQAEKII